MTDSKTARHKDPETEKNIQNMFIRSKVIVY